MKQGDRDSAATKPNGISIGRQASAQPHERHPARCPVVKVADKNYTVTELADVVAINRLPDARGMGGAFKRRHCGLQETPNPLSASTARNTESGDPYSTPRFKRVAQLRDEIAARTKRMIDA